MNHKTTQLLKQRLRHRERQLVVNIDYTNTSLVSYLARNLADVIFIDCEQGDTSIQSIPDLVRASHLEETPCIVRLPDRSAETIERYLYRGVDGIVVPRVETPAQAAEVIAAVDYCMDHKAPGISIIIQIESHTAAKAIDGFLALERTDAFFIGPVDLARSMGHAGDFAGPAVGTVINQLILTIHGAGRCVGMLCKEDSIAQLENAGCRFLYIHTNDFLLHGKTPFEKEILPSLQSKEFEQ